MCYSMDHVLAVHRILQMHVLVGPLHSHNLDGLPNVDCMCYGRDHVLAVHRVLQMQVLIGPCDPLRVGHVAKPLISHKDQY